MGKYVKLIDLTFENVQGLKIPAQYIGSFKIAKIEKEIQRIASNSIEEIQWANEVFLEIVGNPRLYNHEYNPLFDYHPFCLADELPTFGRALEFDDITDIVVEYEDGSNETYYVYYECSGGSDENIMQQTRVGKNGSLYILIGKNLNMDQYVSPEELIDIKEQRKLRHAINMVYCGNSNQDARIAGYNGAKYVDPNDL